MTSIAKPKIVHQGLKRNALGLTVRDYEGGMSTLCAGCGHDSITAAIVQAFFELDIPPHGVAKMSGIGCSSKTPAYFLSASHGFNSVHGRMPSIATGASAANRELHLLGVSGDGDSLSIGLGQFMHALRRNLDMVYIIENNGVYGLTKGQFSASADVGSKAKRGEVNKQPPIDPVQIALALGGSFVARSFSGDKDQLVPLIKAGVRHRGFALIDVRLAVRHVQRSRGLDEELRARARVQPPRDPRRLRAAGRRDQSRLRRRRGDADRAARRQPHRCCARSRRTTTRAIAVRRSSTSARGSATARSSRACSTSTRAEPDMHGVNGTVAAPLTQLPYEDAVPRRGGARDAPEAFPLGDSACDGLSRSAAGARGVADCPLARTVSPPCPARPWATPCDVIHRNPPLKPAA